MNLIDLPYAAGHALLCLPLLAFAEEKPAAPAAPAALDTLIPAIDAHFAGYIEKSHVPGLVYGIVRDGRLIHVGAMGVQDLDAKRPGRMPTACSASPRCPRPSPRSRS